MCLEGERGDDTEVASTPAAQCPEEVRVVARIAGEDVTIGQDDLSREQVVAGQAELATEDADSASKRQTGNAYCWARASGEREALLRERRVDIDEPRTRPYRGDPGACIHFHCVHRGDIYHQAGSRRVAGIGVATGARRERQAEALYEGEAGLNIRERDTGGNRSG